MKKQSTHILHQLTRESPIPAALSSACAVSRSRSWSRARTTSTGGRGARMPAKLGFSVVMPSVRRSDLVHRPRISHCPEVHDLRVAAHEKGPIAGCRSEGVREAEPRGTRA